MTQHEKPQNEIQSGEIRLDTTQGTGSRTSMVFLFDRARSFASLQASKSAGMEESIAIIFNSAADRDAAKRYYETSHNCTLPPAPLRDRTDFFLEKDTSKGLFLLFLPRNIPVQNAYKPDEAYMATSAEVQYLLFNKSKKHVHQDHNSKTLDDFAQELNHLEKFESSKSEKKWDEQHTSGWNSYR